MNDKLLYAKHDDERDVQFAEKVCIVVDVCLDKNDIVLMLERVSECSSVRV
jgi:hypothetical protein